MKNYDKSSVPVHAGKQSHKSLHGSLMHHCCVSQRAGLAEPGSAVISAFQTSEARQISVTEQQVCDIAVK